jgi:hypothetical protein
MTRYYIGFIAERDTWEVFGAGSADQATPSVTGFDRVEGPFEDAKNAQKAAKMK